MAAYRGLTGTVYQLSDRCLASGTEGGIYPVLSGARDAVAKLFTCRGLEAWTKGEKIRAMLRMPCREQARHITWPRDALLDENGYVCGYVMNRVSGTRDLAELLPLSGFPDWRKRVVIAINLCDVVNEAHAMGQCIGDMQPRNFGVELASGHVYAFDSDSFHIRREKNGRSEYFPCVVGVPDYFAPELGQYARSAQRLGDLDPARTFSVRTDQFALAVLIFQLLFAGFHPFTGRLAGNADSAAMPTMLDNILARRSPYFQRIKGVSAPLGAPSVGIVPPRMRRMFRYALLENDVRPTAAQWRGELADLLANLAQCEKGHAYWKGAAKCPWCQAPERQRVRTEPRVRSAPKPTTRPAPKPQPTPQPKPQPAPGSKPQLAPQPATPPASAPRARKWRGFECMYFLALAVYGIGSLAVANRGMDPVDALESRCAVTAISAAGAFLGVLIQLCTRKSRLVAVGEKTGDGLKAMAWIMILLGAGLLYAETGNSVQATSGLYAAAGIWFFVGGLMCRREWKKEKP